MPYYGEISALTTALLWSCSSFLFTAVSIKFGPVQLNVDRLIFATVIIGIVIWIFDIESSVSNSQLTYLILSGIVGLVVGDSFLFKAFKEIGPRVSLLIMSSFPALAALLAYVFLGETLSLWGILGISITLLGIFIVILERQPDSGTGFNITKKGIIYSFLAAGGQGIGLILAKAAFHENPINGLTATFIRIAASVVILLPAAMIFKKYHNPLLNFKGNSKILFFFLTGSLIGPVLGVTLSFEAVVNTKVGIASTLMSTIPIMMLPLSWMVYKEKLTIKSIAGAFLAVGGIAVLFLK